MFLLIVLCLIFIAGVIYSIYERDGIFMLLTIIFIMIVGLVLGCLLGGIGECFENDELYETDETPIVALADSPGSEGRMFLGAGDIKSTLYYYYMTENDDGSKEISKIDSKRVYLYEDEAEQPYIVTYRYHNSSPIVRFFFFTGDTRTEVHVPPNSVKYNFSVDLN